MPADESRATPSSHALASENVVLRRQLADAQTALTKAHAEIDRLRQELEAACRAGKRQAAPFSRRRRTQPPQRPGRKPGAAYGQPASRPVPPRVDETLAVPLPPQCPCGGSAQANETQAQFQEDLVRQTVVRRFDVAIGHCTRCGRRLQGRHPLQTSDALGAAQGQVGPAAVALATVLTKTMGLSHARARQVLEAGWALSVSRSGVCRAIQRLGQQAAPTDQHLRETVRQHPVVWVDETSWRVAAQPQWLWVATSPTVTVYTILPGRGFTQAASLLGADYDGWVHHDGWAPYYRFELAGHQSCVSHLLRRCEALIEIESRAAAQFPAAVWALLQDALALRDRFQQGELSPHGLAVATGRLEAALDRLLHKRYRTAANRRLAKHLRHEDPWLFSFLHVPGLDATNNAAERALRPAVVARKTWGGNRTAAGAWTQQILMSVLQTCQQQGHDAVAALRVLRCSPVPLVLDLVPAPQPP